MLWIYPGNVRVKYCDDGTVVYTPAVEEAVEEIYKTYTDPDRDEGILVGILSNKSSEERAEINFLYKQKYNTSLRELTKIDTSSGFGYLLQLFSSSLSDAEAFVLFQAMSGIGTVDNLIYPIILARSTDELDVLKKDFFHQYGRDLTSMLDDKLTGDFHTIIMTAMQEVVSMPNCYCNDAICPVHTSSVVEADVETMYGAGEGKCGTDSDSTAFVKTLHTSPSRHVSNINTYYIEKYGHNLLVAIDAVFSGTAAAALKFSVHLSTDPWEPLADQLSQIISAADIDENELSMFLVRFHPYLCKINPIYEGKFKLSLREHIRTKTNGKYGELLLRVLEAPVSMDGKYNYWCDEYLFLCDVCERYR